MRVIGYWLGLWDLVYLTGNSAAVWLRVVHTNIFDERYCVIQTFRHKLSEGGRVNGPCATKWMHYSVRKRLAAVVMDSLQGCSA